MKSAFFTGLFLLFCLSGCRSLPDLIPLSASRYRPARCDIPFVTENRQFIHAISSTLPGGGHSLVTGITTVFPDKRSIHVVIMTLEGLVLFEGVIEKDRIDIRRSVPPFSSKQFATGLMHDVRLVFLKPAGLPVMIGSSGRHGFVCRYRNPDESVIDVTVTGKNDWNLILYGPDLHIKRRVTARSDNSSGTDSGKTAFSRIGLIADGIFEYRLDLRLIRQTPFADRINPVN